MRQYWEWEKPSPGRKKWGWEKKLEAKLKAFMNPQPIPSRGRDGSKVFKERFYNGGLGVYGKEITTVWGIGAYYQCSFIGFVKVIKGSITDHETEYDQYVERPSPIPRIQFSDDLLVETAKGQRLNKKQVEDITDYIHVAYSTPYDHEEYVEAVINGTVPELEEQYHKYIR